MKLADILEQYISHRHSTGMKFACGSMQLRRIGRIIGKEADPGFLTSENIEKALLVNGRITSTSYTKRSILSTFLKWCVARGYLAAMPQMPELPRKPPALRPYIFSNAEIRRLLSASRRHKRNCILVHIECIRMIVLLTYTMGLRIHETLTLRIDDIDMASNTVAIRDTKFYKTRILPFNSAVALELDAFMQWRKSVGMSATPGSPLFQNRNGTPVKYGIVLKIFHWWCEVSGIKRSDGLLRKPRIHDLRHSFAVRRLVGWYHEGRDVQALLPYLSVYMGHSSISDTSVYLTMTPDLLQASCERFEHFVSERTSHV